MMIQTDRERILKFAKSLRNNLYEIIYFEMSLDEEKQLFKVMFETKTDIHTISIINYTFDGRGIYNNFKKALRHSRNLNKILLHKKLIKNKSSLILK